jgi:hypothetical protein
MLDGIQYKEVPSAEGGQTFSADFLEKPEEGGILNLPAQRQLNLIIVRPREVRPRLSFFDGLFKHPVGALAGSLNKATLRTGIGDPSIPGRLPPEQIRGIDAGREPAGLTISSRLGNWRTKMEPGNR